MGRGEADTCSTLCARGCDLSPVGPSQLCMASEYLLGTQSGCRQGLGASICASPRTALVGSLLSEGTPPSPCRVLLAVCSALPIRGAAEGAKNHFLL